MVLTATVDDDGESGFGNVDGGCGVDGSSKRGGENSGDGVDGYDGSVGGIGESGVDSDGESGGVAKAKPGFFGNCVCLFGK